MAFSDCVEEHWEKFITSFYSSGWSLPRCKKPLRTIWSGWGFGSTSFGIASLARTQALQGGGRLKIPPAQSRNSSETRVPCLKLPKGSQGSASQLLPRQRSAPRLLASEAAQPRQTAGGAPGHQASFLGRPLQFRTSFGTKVCGVRHWHLREALLLDLLDLRWHMLVGQSRGGEAQDAVCSLFPYEGSGP